MSAPWLAAAFRPFYLLGAAIAPVLIAVSAAGWAGLAPIDASWHAHELVFGFAMAIVAGTLLTALPSWAGTSEPTGRALGLMVLLWLAARVAFACGPLLPAGARAAAGAALPVAMIAWLAPRLARSPHRTYLLALPVLALLALAELAWHAPATVAGAAPAGGVGGVGGVAGPLRVAVWALVVLYAMLGGLLTRVFTGNLLDAARDAGAARAAPLARGATDPLSAMRAFASLPPLSLALELAALASLVALAVCDVAGAPAPLHAAIAVAALLAQGARVMRWRGWRTLRDPIVAAMHLGFAWLVVALALEAGVALGAPWPRRAWVHAFTVGALGSMMLGLMTRVALRHTGRRVVATAALVVSLGLVNAAAVLRVGASLAGAHPACLAVAGALWGLAFATWLACHASALLRASMPHDRSAGRPMLR